MQAQTVIEIADFEGGTPAPLIVAGYWASQAGLIVFILNGVTPQSINLVLDPVVKTLPLSIPGVLYVDIRDEARVREAVSSAQEIYAASRIFRRLTACYGVARGIVRPITTAIAKLEKRAMRQRHALETSDCGNNHAQPEEPSGSRPLTRILYSKPEIAMPVAAPNHLVWRSIGTAGRPLVPAKTTGSSI